MRRDMNKVITERPRAYRNKRRTRALKRAMYRDYGFEDFPNNISMTKLYKHYSKVFSDLLGPLRGYLFKAAKNGRLFSEVYSEIKEILNGNGVSQQHVLGHVFDYLHFKHKKGFYYRRGKNYSGAPEFLIRDGKIVPLSWYGFSPQEMILIEDDRMMIFEHKREYRKIKKKRTRVGGKAIKQINGVWYWVKEEYSPRYVTILKASCITERVRLHEDEKVEKLTQISKKDLKKYNL